MSGVIRLDNKWLRELDTKNKGELGEAIVETHLRSTLSRAPERVFSSVESTSVEDLRVSQSSVTSYNVMSESESTEVDTWTPDVSLVVDIYGSVSEMRQVLTEVKTGQYAELKHNQKRVMGAINNRENILVLRANITLDSEEFVSLQYSTVESDPDAQTGYRLSPITLSD